MNNKDSSPCFLIFDDGSVNSYLAWRLSKCYCKVVLVTNSPVPIHWNSQQFGADQYCPAHIVPNIQALATTEGIPSKFEFVLFLFNWNVEETITCLEKYLLADSIVLVNSNSCVHLESQFNRVLNNALVYSIVSLGNIKRISASSLIVADKQIAIYIGHSARNSPEIMRDLSPQQSYIAMSKSARFNKLIKLISKGNGGRTFKAIPKMFPLTFHLWNAVISVLTYDYLVILFEEFDPQSIITKPELAFTAVNVATEVVDLAKACGCLKGVVPTEILKKHSNRISSEIRKPPPENSPASINYPSVLYDTMTFHNVNNDFFLAHLIYLSFKVGIKVPCIEFMRSMLISKIKGNQKFTISANQSANVPQNVRELVTTDVDPHRPTNAKPNSSPPLEESHSRSSEGTASEGGSSSEQSIDSEIRRLYMGGRSRSGSKDEDDHSQQFYEAKEAPSTDTIPTSIQSKQAKHVQIVSPLRDVQPTEIFGLQSGEIQNEIQNLTSSRGPLEIEDERKRTSMKTAKPPDSRMPSGPNEDEGLLLINGYYNAESLPVTNINTSGDYTRTTRRMSSFQKKRGRHTSHENELIPRHGFRSAQIKEYSRKSNSKSAESYSLLRQHDELFTALSSGYDNTESRFAFVDSYSPKMSSRNKNSLISPSKEKVSTTVTNTTKNREEKKNKSQEKDQITDGTKNSIGEEDKKEDKKKEETKDTEGEQENEKEEH